MLTPIFKVSQDEQRLFIVIKAPYTNPAEADTTVDRKTFLFYCSPYYLRLVFSHNIVDDERSSGKYDFDKGEFEFTFFKDIKGEVFQNLELLTALLAPVQTLSKQTPLIEVLDNDKEPITDHMVNEMLSDDFEWFYPQEVPDLITSNFNFGFNRLHSEYHINKQDEFLEVIDVRNPSEKSVLERRSERLNQESKQFSSDHYLENLFNESDFIQAINHDPNWETSYGVFSETEQGIMLKLKNKEYLMDKEDIIYCCTNMINILLSYTYDLMINEGEEIVESAWNIKTLSATLSWLEEFPSMRDCIISFMRRSLIYPLYRNWSLSSAVVMRVQELLKSGKLPVIKCFLHIYSMFQNREPYYLQNRIYIEDYCTWLQRQDDLLFSKLAQEIHKVNVTKSDLELDLIEWEHAAEAVLKEENGDICLLTQNLGKVNLDTIEEIDSDDSKYSDNESTDSVPVSDNECSEDESSDSVSGNDCK